MKRKYAIIAAIGILAAAPLLLAQADEATVFEHELQNVLVQEDVEASGDLKTRVSFNRASVLVGGFGEIDLEVLELKVQPYVELRLQRKK